MALGISKELQHYILKDFQRVTWPEYWLKDEQQFVLKSSD